MKVIRLEASNVKRLVAVDIKPTGDVIEISGNNGNGKTSVLDSLWWCLAGTSNVQSQPIRKGAETASIKLDLGTLKVTRRFKRQEDGTYTTSLTVENGEGAVFKTPQSMLDALLSSLTFDPLAFARAEPKRQFDQLKRLVPNVDFESIDKAIAEAMDQRRDANRRHKEASAGAGLIVIPEEAPAERIDEEALIDAIANASQHNTTLERERVFRADKARQVQQFLGRVTELREQAERILREATAIEAQAKAAEEELGALPELMAPIDVTAARTQLQAAQEANRRFDKIDEDGRRKRSLEKVASDAALLSDELSAKMALLQKQKRDSVASADLPVAGLGFGEGFITLNDLPFDQASDAEQLSAAIAIAMAMAPKLKVIRVRDGSLLDGTRFAMLCEMAHQRDVQVWVESVNPHTASALIIEDGHLKQEQIEQQQESAA